MMSRAPTIGYIRSGGGKQVEVAWSSEDQRVFVAWAGWTLIGKASSAGDAMRRAEAWLYNK
jgi:hypothetical protein